MSRRAYAYVAGGAGSEETVRANRAAFERLRVVPRMLRGVGERDTSVELFGQRLAHPLLLAPIGALLVALLMVSNVPYPHLTGKIFRGRKRIGHLVQVLLASFILLMFHSLAPLLVFWVYAFVFPLRSLLVRNLRPDPAGANPPLDEHAPHKL